MTEPEQSGQAGGEALLGRVDDLLRRGRGASSASPPPAEPPVLTDYISDEDLAGLEADPARPLTHARDLHDSALPSTSGSATPPEPATRPADGEPAAGKPWAAPAGGPHATVEGELPLLTQIEPPGDPGTIRLEILANLAPVLERLVEARLAERLGGLAQSIATSVSHQIEDEIKTIVRDALDQALLSEIERAQSAQEKD